MIIPACGGYKEKSSFRYEKSLKLGVKVHSILNTRYSILDENQASKIENRALAYSSLMTLGYLKYYCSAVCVLCRVGALDVGLGLIVLAFQAPLGRFGDA